MLIIIILQMWNNKKKQEFEDGEIECYYFTNGNNITILTKKVNNLFVCDLSWNFGNYFKKPDLSVDKLPVEKDTKQKIKLKELYKLYKSLKKQKNKSTEKQLLISALMIVIHDIKEQTYINQKLF